jgi:hypothetical protein
MLISTSKVAIMHNNSNIFGFQENRQSTIFNTITVTIFCVLRSKVKIQVTERGAIIKDQLDLFINYGQIL